MGSKQLLEESNAGCNAAKFYTAYEFREYLMAEFVISKNLYKRYD
jgi:hypothetical protein